MTGRIRYRNRRQCSWAASIRCWPLHSTEAERCSIADIDDFTPDTFFWGNRVEPDDGHPGQVDTFEARRGDQNHVVLPLARPAHAVTADIASWVNDHLYSGATLRPAAAVP